MKVLISGAEGFIGKNLRVRLSEVAGMELLLANRATTHEALKDLVDACDVVVHLAGENRPADVSGFETGNVAYTQHLLDMLAQREAAVPLVFSSSRQAALDNPYGRSKLAAENAIKRFARERNAPVAIFRLPGVFGKWCRPGYNSVVATFCHQIAHDQPIRVDNPSAEVTLVYVDDVVDEIVRLLSQPWTGITEPEVPTQYRTTVGELAERIAGFRDARKELKVDRVGTGFTRALYATYVTYLPRNDHSYRLTQYADPRGVFVEMLKTPDAGQFSFFTSAPGITRGGHYHHTKTEKFLVIQGEAIFRFRHVLSGETYSIRVSGSEPTVVQTVPGWAHDITNEGDTQLICMLWANEVFDRARPDTFTAQV